jgi:hypothetical protein
MYTEDEPKIKTRKIEGLSKRYLEMMNVRKDLDRYENILQFYKRNPSRVGKKVLQMAMNNYTYLNEMRIELRKIFEKYKEQPQIADRAGVLLSDLSNITGNFDLTDPKKDLDHIVSIFDIEVDDFTTVYKKNQALGVQ